jgi:SsrA-binding protein
VADPAPARKLIAENRRARFDYFLDDTVEAGLVLTGTEVKALRAGRANIAESYASAEGRELVLINAYIPEYAGGNRFNHEPRRHRKILLHRRQIDRLIVPTKLYWDDKGRAKLELALAKGKSAPDKRQASAERDWQRDKARLMKDHG